MKNKKCCLRSVFLIAIGLSWNPVVWADLNDGLVAYYPFNGNAQDVSGNGHHAIAIGASLTDGRSDSKNSAYYFDGINDLIEIPHSTINGLSEVSTSIWVKTNKNIGAILSGANNSADNEYLIYYDGDILHFTVKKEFKGKIQFNDDQWHHIAVTRNSSGNVNLYVDAQKINAGIATGNLSISPGGLLLGREQDCLGGCFQDHQNFQGSMDDFRIYNRMLSTLEIQQLYQMDNEPIITPVEPSSDDCWATYENGKLHIPCIKLKGALGEELHYEVDMQYKPLSQPMSFQLTGAKPK
jgi:hypothetical protein